MKIAIIIPAYNEEKRIGKTLDRYYAFFKAKENEGIKISLIVVLNGCSDNTIDVVRQKQKSISYLFSIDRVQAGKGLAIKAGFEKALEGDFDLIGFVDADMATLPQYFYQLITNLGEFDGIIASRYLKESVVVPARPAIKEWGRRFIYHPLIWLLFQLRFSDYQCGAKLFKREVIQHVTPFLTVKQWAFDVELLYLCKKFGYEIKEIPTTWYDQTGSKLTIGSGGLPMLSHLFKVRWRHIKHK